MTKISVIVPIYKVEPYLRRCVDSILAQTYRDFELILIDDGSPDNCGVICDEYSVKDDRIYVIHQQNFGLSAARNAGIDWSFANSDSEYLTFIDSDDCIVPNYLEELVRGIEGMDVACIACSLQEYSEALPVACKSSWEKIATRDYWLNCPYSMTAWGKLYRRVLFTDVRYPVGKIHEDEYVTYRILFRNPQVSVSKAAGYIYITRNDSIMADGWTPKHLDRISALAEQCSFFHDFRDEELEFRAIQRLAHDYGDAIAHGQNFRKQLRCLLGRYRFECYVSLQSYYFIAYPRCGRVMWQLIHIVDAIRRRGVLGAYRQWRKRIS